MKDIAAWQRAFRAAPAVWVVIGPEGEVSSLYESKDAAREEIDFYRRSRGGAAGYHIAKMNIHSLDLARRRWRPDDDSSAAAAETREIQEGET